MQGVCGGGLAGSVRPGHPHGVPMQGPSWGYFKSYFPSGLSTFDSNFPQNGSKNGAERGWDNPTKGLLCVCPGVMSTRGTESATTDARAWIVLVVVKQHVLYIGRIDGPTEWLS